MLTTEADAGLKVAVSRCTSGVTFVVRATPRAGRTEIAGVRGGALVVRLAAAPVDGAANDALVAFLAETFDLPRRAVTILSGHTSRNKRVALAGIGEPEVSGRLDDILSA